MRRVKLVSAVGGIVALSVSTIGLIATIVLAMVLVVSIVSLLIYHQEHVLYIPVVMGYRTVEDNPEGYRSPSEWDVAHDDFYVETEDKQRIHGWHLKIPGSKATVIFCHENAGNIGLRVNNLVAMARHLNVDVVAFDYRGYGSSSGRPSEQGLMLDTDAVYTYVVEKLKPSNLFLYGRSLGGAVALQFAACLGNRKDACVKGVIAENTFTSISDMVNSVFPILNIVLIKKYFLRLRWQTDKILDQIKCPILLISGLKDEIVPASHMADLKRICDAHKLDAQMITFAEGKHNDTWVVGGPVYWQNLLGFITRLSNN